MQNKDKKTRYFHKMRRGFSLLEMVIIVAIIAIMTSVMMVITFKERDTKELETAGREIVAAIREAQNNALTGKQQGPGLPCAFRFWTDGVSRYRVEGSYRALNQNCSDNDFADGNYAEGSGGKVFMEKDLSDDRIGISGFTSNEKSDSGGGHESHSVVFVVPYGKFIDAESEDIVEPSIGTEFILEKNEKMYHICVHSTGLIEELGFVDDDPNSDLECVF
jgi:type II secretory pathway pseudopilin PulG